MKHLTGSGLVLALLLAALPANAFVRTETCRANANPDVDPLACLAGQTPRPIMWPSRCVVYHIAQTGLPSNLNADDVYRAIRESFDSWEAASCSYLSFVDGGFTDEDRVGYNACDPSENANIVIFRSSGWRHQQGALALTSVTYNMEDGEIVDADIELNNAGAFSFTVSTDALAVDIDVANTVTHEAGHLLGLDHSPLDEATMFATAPRGELSKRDLSPDDLSAVCAVYPVADGDDVMCSARNVGFFSRPTDGPNTQCSVERTGCASCAVSERSPATGNSLLLGLLTLGLLGVWRRLRPRLPAPR